VVDLKLQLDVAKLQALGNALDKVDAAIKALPTPSAVRGGCKGGWAGFMSSCVKVIVTVLPSGPNSCTQKNTGFLNVCTACHTASMLGSTMQNAASHHLNN
jgi:L-asparaginase II